MSPASPVTFIEERSISTPPRASSPNLTIRRCWTWPGSSGSKAVRFDLNQCLNLLLRWSHVFAGILWVGTTYYFTWLDGRFTELEKAPKNGSGAQEKSENRIGMVHSGGFYLVEKQKVPNVMPEKLHWFRWEAAFTWLTGILLLILVYYHGGLMTELEG